MHKTVLREMTVQKMTKQIFVKQKAGFGG